MTPIKTTLLPLFLAGCLPLAAEPVLKNSGFDKELAPWECDEGKLADDPVDKENRVLEVELEDGVFALTQDLRWPAAKAKLTFSLRLRAAEAAPDSPLQLRVRL